MPAEEPQMDALHNSLAGRLVDVSLVTEHPFSAAVSREGRQESRRTETVTGSICPWVYLQIFKTSPWLQTETKRNQSESMCYCFNNTFVCEMFFGSCVITDACFKVIYHALHIAVYSWRSFVRKSLSGSCADKHVTVIFLQLYKLVLIFLRYFFKVKDKYILSTLFFILPVIN